MQSLKAVKSTFPVRLQVANAILNFKQVPSPSALHAIGTLVTPSKGRAKRVSQLLDHDDGKLFMKIQDIETLPKKLRVMLGRRKRSGRYDWPVEELVNTVLAAERGIEGAQVIGFGIVKPRFGIVQKFVLLTEYLDEHLNGLQWLEKHPDKACDFIQRCMQLIVRMNDCGFTHLDLWVANIMVPPTPHTSLRVIDMENVYARQSSFYSQALGLQLGFLYRKEVQRFVDETSYDNIVSKFLVEYKGIDRAAFDEFYTLSKHRKLSHRKRRKIFLDGTLAHV